MVTPSSIPQAAALPVYQGQICLVTSRSGNGWVAPKGKLEPGKSARDIALQEAWEEAGLVGFLHEDPLGSYRYEKNGAVYQVQVFLMEVTQVHNTWPEAHERQRAWCLPQHAHRHVYQLGLRELLREIQPSLLNA
jgi:8-oxo-dGTP pyrophosphatase MutT (NUDIX family)